MRAITRNPKGSSFQFSQHRSHLASKAQSLKIQFPEIELVKASLDDPPSLVNALNGAYGVFGVTDFWEHGSDAETRQGKALVDAAKANKVQHFIWSTLDKTEDPLVPHFHSKWLIDGNIPFQTPSVSVD